MTCSNYLKWKKQERVELIIKETPGSHKSWGLQQWTPLTHEREQVPRTATIKTERNVIYVLLESSRRRVVQCIGQWFTGNSTRTTANRSGYRNRWKVYVLRWKSSSNLSIIQTSTVLKLFIFYTTWLKTASRFL